MMSDFHPATIITETKRRVACPACNAPGSTFDHLGHDSRFGPWSCDECGLQYVGQITEQGVELSIVDGLKDRNGLMLIKIRGSEPPVYFVINQKFYAWEMLPDGSIKSDHDDRQKYFVEEHTCPTNLVPVEAILSDGDDDPHGALEYVAHVEIPEKWDPNAVGWDDYVALFPQLGGQIIEGQLSTIKMLEAK